MDPARPGPAQRLLRHAEQRRRSQRFLDQGKVVGRHRLQGKAALAARGVSLVCVDDSVTVWSDGIERRMSISLRAPTVVAKLLASPQSHPQAFQLTRLRGL